MLFLGEFKIKKCNSMKLSNALYLVLFFFLFQSFYGFSQNKISRIEPPNWWVGMNNPNLQLLVYGEKVGFLHPEIDYPGLKLERVIKVENPNYLFLNLVIGAEAQAGKVTINFSQNDQIVESHSYELMAREEGSAEREGFNNSDVLYLITPDRFANGDPGNDEVASMKEKLDRSFKGGRHGGDIKGMLDHLDYISDLGFTAIWLNPVLENNMEKYSYHGYSTTDYYKVDPRFGSNEEYLELSKKAREKGIKMIMDMIVNHCGSFHWWMDDKPTADWINFPDEYVQTNHRKSTIQDPHVAEVDRLGFTDGWFVPTMPDLNQRNELMATYLTQNSIWWVEYAGLAGIRMDTYPYPDMDYMSDWTAALMAEYPDLNIVGEEWHGNPAIVAYWQRGKINSNGYSSELRSLMDFPLQESMVRALNEQEGWNRGWITLYQMLANDFIYADPDELVVFPDNHDMSRIYSQVNEDYDKFKLAMIYTLTTRGIPQVYYGTEILMSDKGTGDHGIIRSDFPGGWEGDKVNGFTGQGLSNKQKEAQTFVKKLLQWRKGAEVIHHGKMIHYLPDNGIYVYFRYSDSGKVMVVLSKNNKEVDLELARFHEMLDGVTKGQDVLSGQSFSLSKSVKVPAKGALILEVK